MIHVEESDPERQCVRLLGMRVDATTYDHAVSVVIERSRSGAGGYVCAANVHMVMEAHDQRDFMGIVEGAALVVPDGRPLVWSMRSLGTRQSDRVYGPSLAMRVCAAAASAGVPVGLYGGHPDGLELLKQRLCLECPGLVCAYAWSPPFAPLSESERDRAIGEITASGARILLVGLGCPKQERWMHEHRARIGAVMLGVGAFFDFYSGRVKQAPAWMQRSGFEWLYRLWQEPRRLFARYAWNNPRFVVLMVMQILSHTLFRRWRRTP